MPGPNGVPGSIPAGGAARYRLPQQRQRPPNNSIRAITRLLHEAKLPRMKTLDAFEFDRSSVSAAQLRTLAEGDYVTKAEPILLVGEAGTGKTIWQLGFA